MSLDENSTDTTVAASAAPPRPVRTAAVLLVVIAVLELAIVATNFVIPSLGGTVTSVGDVAGSSFATGLQAGVWIGAVLRLVLVALYVVMALAVRSGRTWPRTVTIVLAALGVLSVLLTGVGAAFTAGAGGSALPLVTLGVQLIALAAQVAVVVLLFRALSRRWLADRAAQRRLAGSRPAGA